MKAQTCQKKQLYLVLFVVFLENQFEDFLVSSEILRTIADVISTALLTFLLNVTLPREAVRVRLQME